MKPPSKIALTFLTTTAAGFVAVVTLHGPSVRGTPTSNVNPPKGAAGGSSTVVNGSAVGPLESFGYGQLAVKVTIVNGRIADLSVESLQTLESYSQQLEAQVVPILKTEVLQAQGTGISALSGATYTSEAYANSIQGALDKLHFK